MNGGEHKMSDLFISRVVDGAAAPEDWATFRGLAERDPTLWRELAEAQRDHAELVAAVASATMCADEVEAPLVEEIHRRFSERIRTVATYGGWAAAAAVGLMWFTTPAGPGWRGAPAVPGNAASLNPLSGLSADEAYHAYLDKGREAGTVVAEVPNRVLIEARPMKAGGGYEVLYLRQIVERRMVKELNGIGHDEFGRPAAVPLKIDRAPGRGSEAY